MKLNLLRAIKISLSVGALMSVPATAVQANDTFSGKTVEFVIGFGAGGGYDAYSRLIARHIGDHIPGKPDVVPKNMPGAGSARAGNYLYANAPQDGTAIGMIGDGLHLAQQLGESRIKFDILEMNWIGRITNNTPVLVSWHESPIRSTEDLMNKEMIVAADGDTPKLNYALLESLVGVKMKTISGYKRASEAMLAMQRGEIHGIARPWPVLLARNGDMIKAKKIIPVLQTGAEKHQDLPDIPRMIDLAKNDEDRQLFEFFAQSSRIGRSVIAPAGVPPETVALLREAFDDATKDPKFLADAERAKLSLAILDGKQLTALVKKDGQYPATVVTRAKKAVQEIRGK